jgi:hypothetical protein
MPTPQKQLQLHTRLLAMRLALCSLVSPAEELRAKQKGTHL